MDAKLRERLDVWEKQILVVREAEGVFLSLESQEKALYASLFLDGRHGTMAEKEARAYNTPEWRDFSRGLAEAKSEFNHARRVLDFRIKEFEAEYLSFKIESDHIKRAP